MNKIKEKFTQLFELMKNHKKRVIIISAITAAIILLIIILLLVFPIKKANTLPTESSQEDVSSETVSEAEPESSAAQEESEETTESEEPDAGTASTKPSASSTAGSSSVQVQSGSAQKTGYEPLDTLTKKILSNITSSGMTSNAKLNAIYNYVKKNMTYDMFAPSTDGTYDKLISLGYSDYDSRQITLAYDAATYRKGVCDHYSALTMILARAAGIPLYQSGGLSASGSSHAWNYLYSGNEKYLVDTNYGIYMKRFSDSGYTEQMDGKKFFNNFNTYIPPTEEKKISWMFNAGYGSQRFLGNDHGEITQKAYIDRPMYANGALYPEPITPMVTTEGSNNSFSATVSSNGTVIETLKSQSGSEQMYYFSWYPPEPGSYVVEITANSDDALTGHFIIYANIS